MLGILPYDYEYYCKHQEIWHVGYRQVLLYLHSLFSNFFNMAYNWFFFAAVKSAIRDIKTMFYFNVTINYHYLLLKTHGDMTCNTAIRNMLGILPYDYEYYCKHQEIWHVGYQKVKCTESLLYFLHDILSDFVSKLLYWLLNHSIWYGSYCHSSRFK
jgi:hypothetical protein